MDSRLQIDNTLLEVRRACGWLRKQLAGQPPAAVDRAELVLAEALNNIVLHGGPSTGGMVIRISLRVLGATALLRIHDRGRPMDQAPDTLDPAPMPDPLAESGRGWAMIRLCSAAVSHHSTSAGNVTEIEMSLHAEPGRP